MRASWVGVVCFVIVTEAAFAQAPSVPPAWTALRGGPVIVDKVDGSTVRGRLVSVEAFAVAVQGADGVVVQIDAKQVTGIRAQGPAQPLAIPPPAPAVGPAPAVAPAPIPPPLPSPGAAPALSAPPAASDPFNELRFGLEVTRTIDLVSFLRANHAKMLALDPFRRDTLLHTLKPKTGDRVVAFLLNWLLFPGVGSIYQGDKGWGYPLLGGGVIGLGLMVGGFIQAVDGVFSGRSGAGMGMAISGLALFLGAHIAGLARPWLYDGTRFDIVRDFYGNPSRYTSRLRLSPTLIAEPVGLGQQPTDTLLGFGLRGAY